MTHSFIPEVKSSDPLSEIISDIVSYLGRGEEGGV